jgi:hypothetical protein
MPVIAVSSPGCLQASCQGFVTTLNNAQFPQLQWQLPPGMINATVNNPHFSESAAIAAYNARKQVTITGYQV